MIRFPPGGEEHPHDVEWNARVHFFLDLASEGTATRERKLAAAKDCWLYVFDQHGMTVAEVFADDKGRYHGVDLAQYAGKDLRPYALDGDGVASELPLFAGQKSLKRSVPAGTPGDNLLKYWYWILPSPFQLPWSRFPHITDTGKKNTFQNWAESHRGLRASFPDLDEKTGDPLTVLAVECPWLHAMALNQCFKKAQEHWISRFLRNEERTRLRTLCSYVRTVEAVVGKTRFDKNVDDLIFKDHFTKEESSLKEQLLESADLVGVRDALIRYLKGTRFRAMSADSMESPDPRTIATCAAITAEARDGLEGLGGDPEYGEGARKEDEIVLKLGVGELSDRVKKYLDGHPEGLHGQHGGPSWKEARKAAKSYWYLVKAYAAQVAWIAPAKLEKDLKWVARELFGVLVDFEIPKGSPPTTSPNGAVKWPHLAVSAKAEAGLKKKFINNPGWNAFFVALDAFNLAMALKDRTEGKGDMKPVLGALGSFLNTSASAIESSLGRQGAQHIAYTEKAIAEDLAKLAGERSPSAGKGGFGAMLHRFNTPKTIGVVGKAFGVLGSVYEAWNSHGKAKEAGAALDSEAAAAHWIATGATAAVTTGYFLGFIGAGLGIAVGTVAGGPLVLGAIGAWLIFGGTAADLGVKLALP